MSAETFPPLDFTWFSTITSWPCSGINGSWGSTEPDFGREDGLVRLRGTVMETLHAFWRFYISPALISIDRCHLLDVCDIPGRGQVPHAGRRSGEPQVQEHDWLLSAVLRRRGRQDFPPRNDCRFSEGISAERSNLRWVSYGSKLFSPCLISVINCTAAMAKGFSVLLLLLLPSFPPCPHYISPWKRLIDNSSFVLSLWR